ncbi:Nuclear pore protein [Kalmanozyma brasiliensis GHG001]|uniref:Nuclear pore complex protein n=1 Tax=Kalmanozyma brasiliensis (strain GHG001) TaxID=1365824 RepID=V5GRW8_KALBG|nr:Nuclear pore protein [Kalmanozyma brasiliensis GHG001]EST08662.1 Nuclear pore protein [Kalmanozyma brasiliensis GHG001]
MAVATQSAQGAASTSASGAAGSTRNSESSFTAFARVLQACKDLDPAARIDPDGGTALLFADVCSGLGEEALDNAGYVARHADQNLEDDDRAAWQLEQNTWRLIHGLTSERLHRLERQSQLASEEQQDKAMQAYETPLAAIQSIFEKEEHLNELRIIREWLQDTLAPRHIVEVRKGYLAFTKNRVRAEKRASVGGGSTANDGRKLTFGSAASSSFAPKNRGKAVKNLDPDAVSRGEGGLELEDATYEKALLRTLFEYARAGRLDAAFDLCHQTDQSWRAATLRGAMLYHDPAVGFEVQDVDRVVGNRNRSLWKSACKKLAANTNLDEFERALYGSLAGDLSSVAHVSQSWEELLWAHVNAKLEAAVDLKLDERHNWWSQEADVELFGEGEHGAVKLSQGVSSTSSAAAAAASSGGGEGPQVGKVSKNEIELGSLNGVFEKLSQTQSNSIHLEANNPYRLVQRSIISNNLPELFNRFADNLGDMQASLEPATFARLLRFFAHLILYLRLLSISLPDFACNAILSCYVQVLEAAGESDLVAMYASSLEPQSATRSYANFLRSMDVNSSCEAKAHALRQAEEHNLDFAAVARCTVDIVFDELFPTIMSDFDETAGFGGARSGPGKLDAARFDIRLDANEEALVRAIDWLTFDPSTYADAIIQSNNLTRLFLSTGRLHAAKVLRDRMPSDILAVLDIVDVSMDQNIERSGWDTFFTALEAHVAYKAFWTTRPADVAAAGARTGGLSKLERMNWTKALSQVVEQARELDLVLLKRDWLKIPLDHTSGGLETERRARELFDIRQTYIPEIVFRLHDMLVESASVIPTNLNMALRLSEIVADERHKIYLEFIRGNGQNLLQDYLLRVREASLLLLENGGDVFEKAVES